MCWFTVNPETMKQLPLLLFFLLAVSVAQAQEIKSFSLTNVRDNKNVSLTDFSSPLVVVFTSHDCPFDNYYKERLKELVNSYSGKVQFLLVNSSVEAQESAEQMMIHYQDIGAPYLADKDQAVMDIFGAKKSPEAFLLSVSGGKYTVAYSGALDDNAQSSKDVKQSFLKDAIEKLLAGQKPGMATQRAVGCTVRRK